MSRKAKTTKVMEQELEELRRENVQLKRQVATLRRQLGEVEATSSEIRELFDVEAEQALRDLRNTEVTPPPQDDKAPIEEDLVFVLPNGQERRVKRRAIA
jgi:Tfp pilus assembly protein PilO